MEKYPAHYRYSTLRELYEKALDKKGVNQSDIQFVLSLIKESSLDEIFVIMENDYWKKLSERGLLSVFEDINKEHGINWEHHNDASCVL